MTENLLSILLECRFQSQRTWIYPTDLGFVTFPALFPRYAGLISILITLHLGWNSLDLMPGLPPL